MAQKESPSGDRTLSLGAGLRTLSTGWAVRTHVLTPLGAARGLPAAAAAATAACRHRRQLSSPP
jgi:hypothetical protein